MSLSLDLEHSYADAVPALSTSWRVPPVPDPQLLALNEPLAQELGLDVDFLRSPQGLALLSGQVPDSMPTFAQAYAGHQFGGYSPQLGDGRALLLGELVDPAGNRRDLHLKGSGRTPFSRGGDGRATLGPMLRELMVSESLHALGIPTTRSLAVLSTGQAVQRETVEPGAILCRVAASHLRVGTFQYAATLGEDGTLAALAAYAIDRHHRSAAEAEIPALELLRQVQRAQAELVARWMLVGFVHGVMNTDNMTISGESIDFGPCAFLDDHDPRAVFSSIDTGGRYAYGNQPAAALWNLSRFAESLLPLVGSDPQRGVEQVTEVLEEFAGDYERALARGLADKLGLREVDPRLGPELLEVMAIEHLDHTNLFRALGEQTPAHLISDSERFASWHQEWSNQQPDLTRMRQVNPIYIPRNHQLDETLGAARDGDLEGFERMLAAVRDPFTPREGLSDLAGPGSDAPFVTYCGT